MFPNSQRINRGGMVLSELVEMCRGHDFTDIVILHEHRGEPGGRLCCLAGCLAGRLARAQRMARPGWAAARLAGPRDGRAGGC